MSVESLGKMMLLLGGIIVILGLVLILAGRIPFLGKLPGDIQIQTGGLTCFFPIATMIIISLVLTVLINVILRVLSK